MSARTTNAFFASATLHAVLIGLIVWFAYTANKHIKESTPIFELVAGEGDNYAATEAPALGVAGGVKFAVPQPPAPTPSPVVAPEPEPEPSPIVAAASPVEPAPTPTKTPAKTATPTPVKEYKPVNMAKLVDRIADKRAANIEKKIKADQKAAEARAAKEAAINAKRMTKADFDRLNQGKSSPSQKTGSGAVSVKRIDSEGIAGGVAGGSTNNKTGGAGGKALTREDIELSDAYIALLIQRLKEAHKKPDGLSDLLEATVKFRLTSSGSVVSVTIISSSGNPEFDQSVLAAFRRISLPPPPPNLKTSDYTIPFRMKDDG
ncbi:MAG: cell envelope integrity protein TolA [Opitutaceae bacterium]|jgi:colicin import membrane protein